MRIRTVLIAAFLIATLVPSVIFGWWSYRHGLDREFAEVNDRHLLLAQNLGKALERYHRDVVGTFDSISASLIAGHKTPNLQALMSSINLICVLIVDGVTGQVVAKAEMDPTRPGFGVPSGLVETAKSLAEPGVTRFSQVLHSEHVAAKRYLCATDPDYFGRLSQASVHTLGLQGGPMSAEEVAVFGANPNLEAILQVRIWDDQGKVAGHVTPDFDYYAPLLQRVVDGG